MTGHAARSRGCHAAARARLRPTGLAASGGLAPGRFLGSRHGNLENPRGFGQRFTVITGKGPERELRPPMCDRNPCSSMMWKEFSHPGKGVVGTGKRADNISDYMCFLQRKAVVCAFLGDGAFSYL